MKGNNIIISQCRIVEFEQQVKQRKDAVQLLFFSSLLCTPCCFEGNLYYLRCSATLMLLFVCMYVCVSSSVLAVCDVRARLCVCGVRARVFARLCVRMCVMSV